MCDSDIFLAVLAILFPPIAVWIKRGICSADSLINIALCCFAYFPGLIHAWYIISQYPDAGYTTLDTETESHYPHPHHHYYVVPAPAVPTCHSPHPQPQPHPQNQFYGTCQPQYYHQPSAAMAGPPAASNGPERYAGYQQQTPPESTAGASVVGEPPSYASVVRGDHKIQHD